MRAPGMTMMRFPVFTWMTLIVSFLIILAFPAITIALVELMFDRTYGTNFFDFLEGGKPHLWQHLFWIFGHPEVYILILPSNGYCFGSYSCLFPQTVVWIWPYRFSQVRSSVSWDLRYGVIICSLPEWEL